MLKKNIKMAQFGGLVWERNNCGSTKSQSMLSQESFLGTLYRHM